jgi:hypothetical protein
MASRPSARLSVGLRSGVGAGGVVCGEGRGRGGGGGVKYRDREHVIDV